MMKKLGIVLGAAAVAIVSGCQDPTYVPPSQRGARVVKPSKPVQAPKDEFTPNPDVRPVPPANHQVEIQIEPMGCTCLPGTKHTEPCKCGAGDCKCVVVEKPAPQPAAPETTTYIIQRNDTLSGIAQKYGLKVSEIKSLNNLKSDKICVGNKLKLPGKVEVGPQSVPAGSRAEAPKAAPKPFVPYTGETKVYVVKNGDYLSTIAAKNHISTKQLTELNGLKSDVIIPGQKLKVPAGAPGAATEAAPKAVAEKKATAEKKAPAAPAPVVIKEEADSSEAPAIVPEEEKTPAPAVADKYQTYVVAPGEDIIGIALSYGIDPSVIRDLNGLGEGDQVRAGQTIKLPQDGN